ncbi:hypothetical protein Tco_1304479, partial [Tanacetum coccineum]
GWLVAGQRWRRWWRDNDNDDDDDGGGVACVGGGGYRVGRGWSEVSGGCGGAWWQWG